MLVEITSSLIFFILVCFGLTKIIVRSTIFKPIREFLKWEMLNCCLCVGFWASMFVYVLLTIKFNFISMFLYGCLGSGCSYLLDAIIDDNGIRFELIK